MQMSSEVNVKLDLKSVVGSLVIWRGKKHSSIISINTKTKEYNVSKNQRELQDEV